MPLPRQSESFRARAALTRQHGLSRIATVKSDKFESLSDEALFALADKMGLGLPHDLDRVFVVEEILDAIEEDSEDRRFVGLAAGRMEETKYSCFDSYDVDACLEAPPELFHPCSETSIKVLVRDPSWAFAFWEITETELQSLQNADGTTELFLRACETMEDGSPRGKQEFFDIPVSEDDLQWYINLPKPKTRYRIDLCAHLDGKIRTLAHSKQVIVPRQFLDEGPRNLGPGSAELLRLSGLEALDIEPVEEDNPQRILRPGPSGD